MKTKIFAFLMGTTLLLSSCHDWLQVGSETELTEEQIFATDEGFHKALTGVYLGMGSSKLYGGHLTWHMLDYLAQYYKQVSSSSDYYLFTYQYKTDTASGYIEGVWNGLYNLIANCNNLLYNLELKKNEVDPLGYQLIRGEALALRAFFHLDLMRMFGHGDLRNRGTSFMNTQLTIPYVTEFKKEVTPQRTYTETLALMKADLREAIQLLWGENGENCYNWISYEEDYEDVYEPLFEAANGNTKDFFTNQYYGNRPRIDYYSAKAILARVLMWEGTDEGYAEAYKIAEEWVAAENDEQPDCWDWISRSRATNSNLKYRDRVYVSENVWHLGIIGLYTQLGDWFVIPTSSGVYDYTYIDESVAKQIYEYDVNNSLALADYRFSYLLSYNSRKKGYAILKLDQADGELNSSYANKIPLVSTPEMIYMAAEAITEGCVEGKTLQDAVDLLNLVRNKRGITSTFNLSLDYLDRDGVKQEILKEARKEFLCWGQLFYFYKRIGEKRILGHEGADMTDEEYVLPYPDEEVINGGRVQ